MGYFDLLDSIRLGLATLIKKTYGDIYINRVRGEFDDGRTTTN